MPVEVAPKPFMFRFGGTLLARQGKRGEMKIKVDGRVDARCGVLPPQAGSNKEMFQSAVLLLGKRD